MSSLNPNLAGLPPVHPGTFLAEVVWPALEAQGEKKVRVAELLSMSRQAFDNILKAESAITPETALKLGKLLGNGADFWMTMQVNYDLRRARDAMGDRLDAIPTLTAA